MPVAQRHDTPEARGYQSRVRPLAYAAVVLALFVTTVLILAAKAGTSAAMLTVLFTVVLLATACGLWGTAMAVRDTGNDVAATAHIDAHLDRDDGLVAPGARSSL